MSNAAVNIENNVRPLCPADLEQVIAIDSVYVGKPRRRFFEKRLAHAEKNPEDFVHVGVALNGALVGFAAEVDGPSGPLEVQYDNITIDVVPPS